MGSIHTMLIRKLNVSPGGTAKITTIHVTHSLEDELVVGLRKL